MTWRWRWLRFWKHVWWRVRFGRDYALRLDVVKDFERNGHQANAIVWFSDQLLRDVEARPWLADTLGDDLGKRFAALLREDDLPNVSV